ncbi:hypothetical protein J6590_084859 [Homalodisca vitripennis]|nr:hypothetical protein J6590_084859 [Homalodisca vitripennis]
MIKARAAKSEVRFRCVNYDLSLTDPTQRVNVYVKKEKPGHYCNASRQIHKRDFRGFSVCGMGFIDTDNNGPHTMVVGNMLYLAATLRAPSLPILTAADAAAPARVRRPRIDQSLMLDAATPRHSRLPPADRGYKSVLLMTMSIECVFSDHFDQHSVVACLRLPSGRRKLFFWVRGEEGVSTGSERFVRHLSIFGREHVPWNITKGNEICNVQLRDNEVGSVQFRDNEVGSVQFRDNEVGNLQFRDNEVGSVEFRDNEVGNLQFRDNEVGNVQFVNVAKKDI